MDETADAVLQDKLLRRNTLRPNWRTKLILYKTNCWEEIRSDQIGEQS